MNNVIRAFSALMFLTVILGCNRNLTTPSGLDKSIRIDWMQKWFSAWEMVSTEIYALPAEAAPEFLFFDAERIYTTSGVSSPVAYAFYGPDLFQQKLSWRMATHKGSLKLPDGQVVPVGLMTFAAPSNGNGFFVMAAPSYWKNAKIESKELGLEKMLTAVFLHEFAHSRQFKGFGAMVDSIERSHTFSDVKLSDDIVQETFKSDTAYARSFLTEVDKFYEAAFATKLEDVKKLTIEALGMLQSRQELYFKKDKAILKELDNIFLSMEGTGQYTGLSWLIHKNGGNIPFTTAVNAFRRNRNQWSQEEGLAMYLVLNRLTKPNWSRDIFGENPKDIVALLKEATKN